MVQTKIEVFTAMLVEQPDNAMIWYGLASEQYKLENWVEAAKSLRQVVSLNPDYTAAYQMLEQPWLILMTLRRPTGLERWH
jgi:tetratricopeptide (TPR) repeat protein